MRSVRDFGAKGDGATDDTEAIQHAFDVGARELVFPPGDYRITMPLVCRLAEHGSVYLRGMGGASRITMAGPGSAIHLIGSHEGTAGPATVTEAVDVRERMPVMTGLEIRGAHPEACGIRVEGTMHSQFTDLLLNKLLHGIHLVRRARNVIVSHVHIYDNRGVGVFLDHVNLHQINIADSHISYCRQSGIKILNGEVRNVQIAGNDIEYNYDSDAGEDAAPSAEIWIETSAPGATVREGAITGNTIQSRQSPGGANIMIIGRSAQENHKAGMLAIAGNLIGSQEVNVHLVSCRAVTLTGNVIYSGHRRNLLVSGARNIIVSSNSFDHNPDYQDRELATGITFEACMDCALHGCTIQDALAGRHTVATPVALERAGLVEVLRCKRFSMTGCQVFDPAPAGLHVEDSGWVLVSGCSIVDSRGEPMMPYAVRWTGRGGANMLSGNAFGAGTEGVVRIEPGAGVAQMNNQVDAGPAAGG